MANPLLLDMVTYLISNGIVAGDGIDAFRDFSPEAPDNIVSLIEYKGDPQSIVDSQVVNRAVQVTVRDTNANTARSKCLAIYKVLQSDNLVVNFTAERWGQVYLRQPPFRINSDASNRVTYGFNVGITTTID